MVHVPAKFRENTSNAFSSYSVKTKHDGRIDGQTDGGVGGGGGVGVAISTVPGPTARREITTQYLLHNSKGR